MIVILAGVPRSGKSTISKIIFEKYNYSYIPFDSFVSTFNKLYPELGITHYDDYKIVSKKIAPFVKELINYLIYEDISVVIDIYQLTPDDVKKYELDGAKLFILVIQKLILRINTILFESIFVLLIGLNH